MATIKRVVSTNFWDDDKVSEQFTPEDKFFFLYLMTNPYTTQLGIYAVSRKQMAFHLGYSVETVDTLIDRFQNVYGIIKYSNKTREVAIKNYLRHSIVKGGKPVEDLLKKEISGVKDKELLQWVYDNLIEHNDLNESVLKIISFLNQNQTKDDSYHDSYHDSYPFNPTMMNDNENDNENEISKKECNKKKNQSYDELFEGMGVKPIVKEALIEFIRHLQANGTILINSRLEDIIVGLDMRFMKDEAGKVKYINDAISKGYKRLPFEGED